MKSIICVIIVFVVSLSAFSQGRDTLVTKQLYFIQEHENIAVLDTSKAWSNKLSDYVEYSRIEMGRRMNLSIKYAEKAQDQFNMGMVGIAIGSFAFIKSANSKPILYVETSPKYTRDYFLNARQERNTWMIGGCVFTAVGAYFIWRSYKNNKKSRWAVYPDGLRYHF